MALAKRKSTRLKNCDYSANGAYFVTICSYHRECIFGRIENAQMYLSQFGKIAYDEVLNTHYNREQEHISIAKFIIMPNHVHMIVMIESNDRDTQVENRFSHPIRNSLATIVGGYKSAVTRKINKLRQADMASHVPTVWQSRYHEHLIRNQSSYSQIWEYIDTNPLKWELDRYYTV